MPEALKEKFKIVCRESGRTMTSVLRDAMLSYIEQQEIEQVLNNLIKEENEIETNRNHL